MGRRQSPSTAAAASAPGAGLYSSPWLRDGRDNGETSLGTLWTVEQRIAQPALECFQFSPGTRHGIPWRRDSVYLPLDDFALLARTLHGTLRWFHAHGVTRLEPDAASRLAAALQASAADAAGAGRSAALAAALGAWVATHATDGITIERAWGLQVVTGAWMSTVGGRAAA